MAAAIVPAATLDDLMRYDGKAELIAGRIAPIMPTGRLPGRVAVRIILRLAPYVEARGIGEVHADGVGYAPPGAPATGRQSFCPDVSYFTGPEQAEPMRFIEAAPDLAVEVRSENDYGPAAEDEMAEKRREYFALGTLVVWDVDPLARLVRVYRSTAPDAPAVYGVSDTAEAEPAAPGWRVAVRDLLGA